MSICNDRKICCIVKKYESLFTQKKEKFKFQNTGKLWILQKHSQIRSLQRMKSKYSETFSIKIDNKNLVNKYIITNSITFFITKFKKFSLTTKCV